MKMILSCCLAIVLITGSFTNPISKCSVSGRLISGTISASASEIYRDTFIDGHKYRIRSYIGNGKYYIGTANNKSTSKTNVEIVSKKDSSSIWTAHYSAKYDAWYFTLGNTNMALNPFADKGKVKNKTNVNLYKLQKNDPTQTFTIYPYSDGTYSFGCFDNPDLCLEISGYSSNATKGTNIRLYKESYDFTQRWYVDPV